MTKFDLLGIVDPGGDKGSLADVIGYKWINEILTRLEAALEKEREGEVVLGEGVLEQDAGTIYIGDYPPHVDYRLCGKQGQLIFRPTKAEKGGELDGR